MTSHTWVKTLVCWVCVFLNREKVIELLRCQNSIRNFFGVHTRTWAWCTHRVAKTMVVWRRYICNNRWRSKPQYSQVNLLQPCFFISTSAARSVGYYLSIHIKKFNVLVSACSNNVRDRIHLTVVAIINNSLLATQSSSK